MIDIRKPRESRQRDDKRNRILLIIGDSQWHLSQEEAKYMRDEITKYLVEEIDKSLKG